MTLYTPHRGYQQSTKNKIFLNDQTVLDFSRPEKATNMGWIGGTGGGKSVGVAICASQFDHALWLDPKPGQPGWNTIKEIGEKNNWTRYEIRGAFNRSRIALKINVREVGAGVINVLCLKKESSTDIRLRRLLFPFFSKVEHDPSKNWDSLERLLYQNKLDPIADELKSVLDENDAGLSLDEVCTGRKVVNIADFDSDNRGIGLLIGAIFFHKGEKNKNKNILTMPWSDRMFIGCDEAHTHAKMNSAIGTAMGYCFSQGRSFGITGCVSGTNEGVLHTMIKANIKCYFFFQTDQEKDKIFKKYGVDLDDDAINFMREEHREGGNCFMKAEDFGYVEPLPIHLNFFYQQLREQKNASIEYVLKDFNNYVR